MKLLEGWVDQQQCVGDYGWTEAQRLLTLVEIAESMLGMMPTDPRYLSAMYPWDSDADAFSMAQGQHKCGLTGLAALRAFGYILPADIGEHPYKSSFYGKIPDAITQLRQLSTWETGPLLPIPGEGGILIKPGDPFKTHYYMAVKIEGNTITSVDGGKTGPVRETDRTIVVNGRKVYLKEASGEMRLSLGVLHTGLLMPERNWMLPG
jgi:hypothetical protein